MLLLVWLPALAALAVPGGAGSRRVGRVRRALAAAAARRGRAGPRGLARRARRCRPRPPPARRSGTALGDVGEVLDTRFGTVWGLGALAWLRGRCSRVAASRGGAGRAARDGRRRRRRRAARGRLARALALPLAWLVCLPGARRARERAGAGRRAAARERPARGRRVGLDRRHRDARASRCPPRPGGSSRPTARACWSRAVGRFSTRRARVGRRAARRRDPPVGARARRARRPRRHGVRPRDRGEERARVVPAVLGALEPAAHAARARARGRAGAPPGRPGVVLRRALRAEVALGVAALAATGALAGYSPRRRQATGPYSASADLGPARAELTVEPALAGPNEVHVYFFDRADGTPVGRDEGADRRARRCPSARSSRSSSSRARPVPATT